jgi:ABC-type transporter Mla subunit MlaD
MNLNEFESRTRDAIEQSLNQLQTATSQLTELEGQIVSAGESIQAVAQLIEEFIAEQRGQSETE